MAFTNGTEEDKLSVLRLRGNAEGSQRGRGARTCPQDKQGSDKTEACNIHPTQNK